MASFRSPCTSAGPNAGFNFISYTHGLLSTHNSDTLIGPKKIPKKFTTIQIVWFTKKNKNPKEIPTAGAGQQAADRRLQWLETSCTAAAICLTSCGRCTADAGQRPGVGAQRSQQPATGRPPQHRATAGRRPPRLRSTGTEGKPLPGAACTLATTHQRGRGNLGEEP